MTVRQKPHFAYIECARGYAVLLVIICHATYLFPELPYPVHRVTVLSWHGVQLFFLASAVTLMMSWRHEKTATVPLTWLDFSCAGSSGSRRPIT